MWEVKYGFDARIADNLDSRFQPSEVLVGKMNSSHYVESGHQIGDFVAKACDRMVVWCTSAVCQMF